MRTTRPLTLAKKSSRRGKWGKDPVRQLIEATLKYFKEKGMRPKDIETYMRELKERVQRIKKNRGQSPGKSQSGK